MLASLMSLLKPAYFPMSLNRHMVYFFCFLFKKNAQCWASLFLSVCLTGPHHPHCPTRLLVMSSRFMSGCHHYLQECNFPLRIPLCVSPYIPSSFRHKLSLPFEIQCFSLLFGEIIMGGGTTLGNWNRRRWPRSCLYCPQWSSWSTQPLHI